MGQQGNRAAREGGQQLLFGRKLGGRAVGDQGRYGDSDKGMQGVPNQVESRDLIRKEFNRKKNAGGCNHPPTAEQMQTGGQIEQAGMGEQSERGDRGIHVQSGRETYRHDQTCQLGASEFGAGEFSDLQYHGCHHIRSRPPLPMIRKTVSRKTVSRKTGKGRLGDPFVHYNSVPCDHKVDSISKPQASSKGSGMYLEFLLRRAHSRSRVDRKYWSGESLYSCTTCSNSVTVGMTGPIGSGLPQFGFPRRLAMKNIPSSRIKTR